MHSLIYANLVDPIKRNLEEKVTNLYYINIDGIELIKENLLQCKKDTSDEISLLNSEESGDKSTFLLAVLDCLWNVVFNNKRSEHFFLDIGVYIYIYI